MTAVAQLATTVPGLPTFIPSPSQGVWYLGPLPLRAYALAILAGIFLAIWLGERRWRARGGPEGTVTEVAVWAVPFGIVGGRLYHVVSSPDAYFGSGGDPWRALEIWRGGLGIWGAVALGAVGAWIGCRRAGVRLPAFADAVAPGILLAQAVGRIGNYFNQELFGAPTTLPWALEIDPPYRPDGYEQFATFHPTFLYELVWNVAGVGLLLWLDRRYRLGHGRVFWAYVVVYTLGRVWIEALRIDEAERVLGLRLNVWTSVVLCLVGVLGFWLSNRLRPGRERDVTRAGRARPAAPSGADEAGGEQHAEEPAEAAGEADTREDPPAHAQGPGQDADHGERR
ncbi:prolipoprotein diacylglyceryl transferase [Thalassiella azotivora]